MHRRHRHRRLVAALVVGILFVLAFGIGVMVASDDESAPRLVPSAAVGQSDPLAFDESQTDDLERAAAFGLSHPLYAKSPGGVIAAAERTAGFRPFVESAARGSEVDPDVLEAIVLLESGGRVDVVAGDDPARASGLTQILAETATGFLGMNVDLDESRRLTLAAAAARARGDATAVEQLLARRRAVDDRFDPALALAGAVRYLTIAKQRLGRDDLAVVSYHMGIGNLSNVIRAYTQGNPRAEIPDLVEARRITWARIFFDTSPIRNEEAWRLLSRLQDDSPTYYWRVLAAQEIMRLHREDPERLAELATLHRAKASAEEVLHPPSETERFEDPADVQRAFRDGALQPVPDEPARLHFRVDPQMGELAGELNEDPELYRGLRPAALAMLVYMAERVHALSGAERPLRVTSTVRDEAYQQLLRRANREATQGYSLHTTGYAFDILRSYESRDQAVAFQHVLDDLEARGLIAWVREPAAIHVTVGSGAEELVPTLLAEDAP